MTRGPGAACFPRAQLEQQILLNKSVWVYVMVTLSFQLGFPILMVDICAIVPIPLLKYYLKMCVSIIMHGHKKSDVP